MDATWRRLAAYDDVLAVTLPGKSRLKFREQRGVNDCDSGPACFKEVSVIVSAQGCARRHRHGPNFHRAEVRRGKFRDVGENQQDSLFLFESKLQQRIADSVYLRRDICVR